MPRSRLLSFVKMQALGNDLLLVDALRLAPLPWPQLAQEMCPRHFGIGADGLLVLLRSDVADFRMRMFNPNGSEDMCGNGLRCLVKYLHDSGLATRKELQIETFSGLRRTRLLSSDGRQSVIEADMGTPSFSPADLPMATNVAEALRYPLDVDGRVWEVNCVSVGTPHAVIFAPEEVTERLFDQVSPRIQAHPLFPEKISVDWCQPQGDSALRLRVWERAVGETLACGTGACAAAVAARMLGYCGNEVSVHLPGGTLKVTWSPGEQVIMTGPAEEVFRGRWPLKSK
jgi:diaminopimelate epimerase